MAWHGFAFQRARRFGADDLPFPVGLAACPCDRSSRLATTDIRLPWRDRLATFRRPTSVAISWRSALSNRFAFCRATLALRAPIAPGCRMSLVGRRLAPGRRSSTVASRVICRAIPALRPPRTSLRGEIAEPSPSASLRSPSPANPAFLSQAAGPPLRAGVPLRYVSPGLLTSIISHFSRKVGNGKASPSFNIRWAPVIINVIARFLVAVYSVDFSFELYLSLHSQSPTP